MDSLSLQATDQISGVGRVELLFLRFNILNEFLHRWKPNFSVSADREYLRVLQLT